MLGDRGEAEDCAQETFVKVYRSLRGFRFGAKFSTWLYTIAVNTCRNRLKSAGYRFWKGMVQFHPRHDSARDNDPIEIADPAPSPLAQLTDDERELLLQQAIDALPGDFKAVVVLRDIEGLSYDEIAEVTGHHLGTIKSRLARARQQLREILKGVI
jgi:RNA polymerase sigma-70 factor (ECF subfamily)